MTDQREIVRRKDEHLDLALQDAARPSASAFDRLRLEHSALPELDLDAVDLSTRFLGWPLAAPFLISAMTGGPERGAQINDNLARAAQTLGIPFAVGSQRVALEGASSRGIDRRLRDAAPDIPIWANLGAAQLVLGYGADEALRAVEMIGADALVIHLNPLQEAVQVGGDVRWRGVLAAIAELTRRLDVPVIVKEVGYGISGDVARRLDDAGVAAVDVAGAGGTAWASIEAERTHDPGVRRLGEAFVGWGIPTPECLIAVKTACPELPLVASGGIRNGVDAAKAIRLGAGLVGQAAGVLPAALISDEAVVAHVRTLIRQLQVACFCTGAGTLDQLRKVRLTSDARPLHDL